MTIVIDPLTAVIFFVIGFLAGGLVIALYITSLHSRNHQYALVGGRT